MTTELSSAQMECGVQHPTHPEWRCNLRVGHIGAHASSDAFDEILSVPDPILSTSNPDSIPESDECGCDNCRRVT